MHFSPFDGRRVSSPKPPPPPPEGKKKKKALLGQISKKICVSCRGLNFGPILMKHGQNVCLNQMADEFEIGSCVTKN